MYDVLPTLGNMFVFNSPYALVHDIFSTDENVVASLYGNWLINKIYYSFQGYAYYKLRPDEPVSIEYMNHYSKHVGKVISISNSIITYI